LSKVVGRWRIKWMEMWDQDFVDLIEPGYFQFDEDGLGFFVFGAVEGQIDYRIPDDGGRVEFHLQIQRKGNSSFIVETSRP